jgi:hypothetical protein
MSAIGPKKTFSPRIHWIKLLSLKLWMYCREDLRKLKRITLLWDYIREVTERNQGLLMGESREMLFAD